MHLARSVCFIPCCYNVLYELASLEVLLRVRHLSRFLPIVQCLT